MNRQKQFLPIPGRFGNYYRAHADGRIWSVRQSKWMKPQLDLLGHKVVTLYEGKTKRSVLVYRIIAATFHGRCPDNMEISFLDSNPLNVAADNIFFAYKDYGTRPCPELTEQQVAEVQDIQFFFSDKELAVIYGTLPSEIFAARTKVIRGRTNA